MLQALGMDRAAEQVYRAMLTHPQAGVAELGTRLGLPEEDVRHALDALMDLTLVRPSAERQGRIRAVSPEIGMEILVARQQAELAAQQQRVESSRVAAAQLIAEYAELRPATAQQGVEQLTGLDRIRDRLAVLTRETTTEVMTFAPDGAHTRESIAAARPLNQELLDRGVHIRTLYLDSVRNSPETVEYVDWLTERGGQVRTAPSLPIRMIISDRSSAVLPVSGDNPSAGALLLTGHGTLTALCALFESVWASAQPLGSAKSRDERGLTGQESTVVRLLAAGHTDEAIAKRLGVSSRTARRIATDLMERLGAHSRFEAGVKAVRRGWLPAHD
ncbi:LuxR C-terminal-related transcriptional regulator [Streptomyces roseoverticillatus]|uniref:LuxR C-terminal-related transcriptional regulator n=1 Tax=Streptomyces roseoverticillatus TaxID=66429 RepID=UPI0033F00833